MKRKLCTVTTIDNPNNPFEDYRKWLSFDMHHGYNTPAYLGNFLYIDNDLPDVLYDEEIERACDEIVAFCPLQNYKKVVKFIDEPEYEDVGEYKPLKEDIINEKTESTHPGGGQ